MFGRHALECRTGAPAASRAVTVTPHARRSHHPRHHRARTGCGGSTGTSPHCRSCGRRRRRSWSTSATGPDRGPRSSWPSGCGAPRRTSGCSASRSIPTGWPPPLPHATASVTFARGGFEIPTRRAARAGPGDERAAAVRGGGGAGRVGARHRAPRAGRPARRRHLRRARPRSRPGWTSPRTAPCGFTISLRLAGLETPGVVAERLPKALIHRNVPGERVHDLLGALDAAWQRAAPLSVYGPAAALRRPRRRRCATRACRCSAPARAGGSASSPCRGRPSPRAGPAPRASRSRASSARIALRRDARRRPRGRRPRADQHRDHRRREGRRPG